MNDVTKLEKVREDLGVMKEKQQEYLQYSEGVFEQLVPTLTPEFIENMTDEELLKFNRYEEGKLYIEEPDFETQQEVVDYVRSIMLYLVETYVYTKELDEKMAELDTLTEELNDVAKESMGIKKEGDSIDIIEAAFEKCITQANEEQDEVKLQKVLKSQELFNETFTLDRLKEVYSRINPQNLKDDASCYRSVDVYKKYLKVQKQLGSNFDLTAVVDLEKRFLPKEYHHLNNLFVFACIKYISKMQLGRYSKEEAFFASQLTSNLYLFSQGKLKEERSVLLLNNIKEFLDILK